jgi:hypothetical protein
VLNERTTNVNIQDVETFTQRLRGQFGVNYVGDFGSGISLPASENITGSLIHTGNFSTENLTFSRYVQGQLSDNLNIGLTDSLTITPQLNQQFDFAYAKFSSQLSSTDTFHIESITHYTTNASLSTPIGNHIINSITYNEQHPIGPTEVPFELLDHLSDGAHSAQDVLRFYNGDVYSFSLSDGTSFDRQAQSLTYQLNYRPSPKSYLVVGGYFQPGSGQGFGTTNVQAITPFGKDTSLQFSTNVDWKNHNRLEDKNIYLSKTVDNCYNLLASYNQDLKAFSFSIVILAFPGQSVGFGLGGGAQSSPILPQSFAF